jgi:hypothetical protein
MGRVVDSVTESETVGRAIADLESGQPEVALEYLREALGRGESPASKPDSPSSTKIKRVRAYMAQAASEISQGRPLRALHCLRKAQKL